MGRDGDETKDFRQRRRPIERRRTDFGQKMMPKPRHPAVYTGMAFAILGGMMIAATFLVSWVDGYDLASNALVRQLHVWEMAGVPEWDLLYYLALLAPIAGAACAVLSGTALANESRIGIRRLAAAGVLFASVIATIAVTALILLLKDVYIAEQLERSVYGPAIFLSVFGCVLGVAGGIVLSVDYFSSARKKGKFVAAAGSKHLKAALKPARREHLSQNRGLRDNDIREEMLAEESSNEAEGGEGLSCPNCNSPVKANWKLCPVCGEQLG